MFTGIHSWSHLSLSFVFVGTLVYYWFHLFTCYGLNWFSVSSESVWSLVPLWNLYISSKISAVGMEFYIAFPYNPWFFLFFLAKAVVMALLPSLILVIWFFSALFLISIGKDLLIFLIFSKTSSSFFDIFYYFSYLKTFVVVIDMQKTVHLKYIIWWVWMYTCTPWYHNN